MFNIGGGEIMVIALIALIVVGPEQLPGLLRKAGQLTSQLRSLSNGFRDEFMNGVNQVDPTRWTGDGTDQNPIVPRGYSAPDGHSTPHGQASPDGQATPERAAPSEVQPPSQSPALPESQGSEPAAPPPAPGSLGGPAS